MQVPSDHRIESRVTIVGAGHVGSTMAFSLLCRGLCEEIVLVNRTRAKAEGEAADLQHAAGFAQRAVQVRAGDIPDTAQSDVIIFTIGAPGVPGSRTAGAQENAKLLRQMVPEYVRYSPDAILLIVTNPVDAMSYVAWKASGLPSNRVLGTGTLIDSARFRTYLSRQLQIHPDDIRAYVLGEHGETQFPAVSVAATGGQRLDPNIQVDEAFRQTVESAHEIFAIKGYTNYAIALAGTMIVESILNDSRRTLPVSTYVEDYAGHRDVYLSLPAVIGRNGVQRVLQPGMNEAEQSQLTRCVEHIRRTIDACGLNDLPTNPS